MRHEMKPGDLFLLEWTDERVGAWRWYLELEFAGVDWETKRPGVIARRCDAVTDKAFSQNLCLFDADPRTRAQSPKHVDRKCRVRIVRLSGSTATFEVESTVKGASCMMLFVAGEVDTTETLG